MNLNHNNIKVLPVHKAASALQKKICTEINFILGKNRIIYSRLTRKTKIINQNDIIILRHPLNKLISEYYSYGWSHTTKYHTEQQFEIRDIIRQQSLDEYIITDHKRLNLLYNKVFNEAKMIIKYEDIMDYPQRYLKFLLKKIDEQKIFDEIWNRFKTEFEFQGTDLSEDIINEKVKSHRRNLDHLEYEKKLLPQTIKRLDSDMIETIKIYNSLSSII